VKIVYGILAMSRVRGSLFAAKPQILLRSSGGSFGKTVNTVLGFSIAKQWVRAMWCEMIGVCCCFLLWNEVDDSSNLFVTWRGQVWCHVAVAVACKGGRAETTIIGFSLMDVRMLMVED